MVMTSTARENRAILVCMRLDVPGEIRQRGGTADNFIKS